MLTVHQQHQCSYTETLTLSDKVPLCRKFRTTALPFLIPPSQTVSRLLQTLSGNYILFTEEGSSVSLRDHNRSMSFQTVMPASGRWWQLLTQTPQLPKVCSWAAAQHWHPTIRAVRMLCPQGSYRNPRLSKECDFACFAWFHVWCGLNVNNYRLNL